MLHKRSQLLIRTRNETLSVDLCLFTKTPCPRLISVSLGARGLRETIPSISLMMLTTYR